MILISLKIALRHSNSKTIFQNQWDQYYFIKLGIINAKNATIINGSGVDLDIFNMVDEPKGVPKVLMIGRLLRTKGVSEYIQAATIIQKRKINAKFQLVGDIDPSNPSSISFSDLEDIKKLGYIDVLGFRTNVSELISEANVVVLPSYREGLPRVLEEAAACGRAVVTTDVPGCRDAIVDGVTGLLVPAKDSLSLANAVQSLIQDNPRRLEMGLAGRLLAEKKYSLPKIVKCHLRIYRNLLETKA